MTTEPLLRLAGVGVRFGHLDALADVDLDVAQGERRALIGPNGAGKSTLFSVVAGMRRPTTGQVFVEGRDVTHLPVHRRVALGVATTFQHSSLFLRETALENVLLPLLAQPDSGRMLAPAQVLGSLRRRKPLLDKATDLLNRVGLGGREATAAAALSHGERRQLELAVALATSPRLLLLDEPAAGMSMAETDRLMSLLRDLPKDVTLLLVEHDLDVVFGLADRVTVLHLGRHLMTGSVEEVRASDEVQRAYLGDASADDLFEEPA
jgi:branched-chain amino acid transport system ATP-binding protein